MGICNSILSVTELKEFHSIDIYKLWEEFVKDCCEVAPGNFIPYFAMDAAFLTYAIENLKLYDSELPKYKNKKL
jgi:hypothetical protein